MKKMRKTAACFVTFILSAAILSGCGDTVAMRGSSTLTDSSVTESITDESTSAENAADAGTSTEGTSESASVSSGTSSSAADTASNGTSSASSADEKSADENSADENVLSDGTYTPDGFTFSGGTGRVEITCPEFTVKNGEITAKIVFSSRNYDYLKVGGTKYTTTVTDDGSEADVPAVINEDMELIGDTTAMSEPHEITYTIHISYGEDAGESGDAESAASGSSEAGSAGTKDGEEDSSAEETASYAGIDPQSVSGLTYSSKMDLQYATGFDVYYYEDGYKLIDVHDNAQYLVVPEGKTAPDGLDSKVVILQQPLDEIYVAATSSMSLFAAIDSIDAVTLTGTDESGWYIDAPKEALKNGTMTYAGKYSAPDYELLVGSGCDLAIESTMIYHTPEVKEMLESLGIPVFIDRSSYESHPLGRTEWVKLYAAMMNKETEAETFFDSQAKIVEDLEGNESTGKTVGYFAITSNGSITVRASEDYIPSMIRIAGGEYVFDDLKNGNSSSGSVTISMEEFYAAAADADYLVYNSTIEGELGGLDELIAKDSLFADFKAVKEGNVYQVSKSLYQSTDIVGEMIRDFHTMVTGDTSTGFTFLEKLT